MKKNEDIHIIKDAKIIECTVCAGNIISGILNVSGWQDSFIYKTNLEEMEDN